MSTRTRRTSVGLALVLVFACTMEAIVALAAPLPAARAQDPTALYLEGQQRIREGQNLVQQGRIIAAQTRSAIATATAEVRQTETAIARATATAQAQATATAQAQATATARAQATGTSAAIATATKAVSETVESIKATGTSQMATATMDAVVFAENIRRQHERINVGARALALVGLCTLVVLAWFMIRAIRPRVVPDPVPATSPVSPAGFGPGDIEVNETGQDELWEHLQAEGIRPAEVNDV